MWVDNENSVNLEEGMMLEDKAGALPLILTLERRERATGLDKSLIAITTTVRHLVRMF